MLLNGTFSLLGIQDVEAFTGRIVERSGLRLSVADREELHVWLIEECWLLSTRYRPGRAAFAALADRRLRLRLVDWQRARFRTRWVFKDHVYERPRPQLVPLDDPDRDRLGTALAARSGDPSADSSADLERFLEDGDRQAARDIAAMGLSPYG